MRTRISCRKVSMFLMLALFAGSNVRTQTAPVLNLMPQPASVQVGSGALKIDASFAVAFTGYKDARLERAGQRFLEQLRKQTGLLFFSKPGDSGKATLVVHTDKANKEIQELGEDESYTLEVTSSGARLDA